VLNASFAMFMILSIFWKPFMVSILWGWLSFPFCFHSTGWIGIVQKKLLRFSRFCHKSSILKGLRHKLFFDFAGGHLGF
jgi:hypothetical protein